MVTNVKTGETSEFVYQTQAKGSDVYVGGTYQGFSLAFEIQRRKTLVAALREILPQVVDSLIKAGLKLSDQPIVQGQVQGQMKALANSSGGGLSAYSAKSSANPSAQVFAADLSLECSCNTHFSFLQKIPG